LLAVRGEYQTLALTEAGAEVLRGRQEVKLRKDTTPAAARSGKAAKSARTPRGGAGAVAAADLSPEQHELFERLRAWRKEAAEGKPPYVVFSDATLREIVTTRPTSLDELSDVNGVGAAKLAKYGETVLALLAADAAA
jgi:ATP-dependent DNA helicase RecQ